MAANRCRHYKTMDDPWYSVNCNRPLGHGGKHRFEWATGDEGDHSLKRKASANGAKPGYCLLCGARSTVLDSSQRCPSCSEAGVDR